MVCSLTANDGNVRKIAAGRLLKESITPRTRGQQRAVASIRPLIVALASYWFNGSSVSSREAPPEGRIAAIVRF